MSQLYELFDDIMLRAPALQENPEAVFDQWQASMEYLERLLVYVGNPYTRQSFKERYMKLL